MRFIKNNLFSYVSIIFAFSVATILCANFYSSVAAMSDGAVHDPIVIIDAGHGGEDGGAVSSSGVMESTLNLEIAHRVDDLFHLLGQETFMIRTEDVSVYTEEAVTISEKKVSDLKNRVRMVNSREDPVLVSIHQNMFQESKYDGAQVFYAPTDGSKEMAEELQQTIADVLDPGNHRTAKPADSVYLMNHIACPAILLECGFLSNKEECQKLCTAAYQKQIAIVLTGEVTDYIRKANTNEV